SRAISCLMSSSRDIFLRDLRRTGQVRHAVPRRNAPPRAGPTLLPAKCAGKFVLLCRASDGLVDPSRNRLACGPQALLIERVRIVGGLKVDFASSEANGG